MMRRERSTAETTRERLSRNFRKPSSSRRKNDPTDGSSPRARRAFLTLRFRSGCKRRMTSATCGGMTSRYRPIYRRRLCVGRSGSPKTSSKERPCPPAAKYRRLRRICRMSAGSLSTSRVALRRSYSAKFTKHRSRLALAGHHDLFLTLLDAGQQLGEVRLHLGDGQRASHAARLHVDQNSARRVSRPGTPSNPTPLLVTGSRPGRATRPSGRTTSPSGPPRDRRWSGAAPGGCETG